MDDNALFYQMKQVMNIEDCKNLFINEILRLDFSNDDFEHNTYIKKLFDEVGGFFCIADDNKKRFFVALIYHIEVN